MTSFCHLMSLSSFSCYSLSWFPHFFLKEGFLWFSSAVSHFCVVKFSICKSITRKNLGSTPGSGLRRTSTSSPSWISKFLVSVPRLLVSTPKVCSPTKNVMDKNKDVADDSKDGNGGFQDPGRRGRRRPEEPWSISSKNTSFKNSFSYIFFV